MYTFFATDFGSPRRSFHAVHLALATTSRNPGSGVVHSPTVACLKRLYRVSLSVSDNLDANVFAFSHAESNGSIFVYVILRISSLSAMDYRVFFIPVLLTATAALMYWLFNENPDYAGMADHKKHEFIARINGVMFSLYQLCMWMFVGSKADTLSMIEQVLAYMVYDAGHMAFYARSPDFFLHHVIIWLGYLFGGHTDQQVKLCFDAMCILESTNPSFSLGWLMEAVKYPYDSFHMGILAFIFGFWTLIRMVYFPYWSYVNASGSLAMNLVTGGYTALNAYWFYLLCKKAQRVVTNSSPSPADAHPSRAETPSGPSGSSPRSPPE